MPDGSCFLGGSTSTTLALVHIGFDFVTSLPLSNGHTVLLTVVDRFSKAFHFIPLPELRTTAETTQLLVQHVFRLVSDCGPQLISQVWKVFCRALGA